MLTTGGRFMSLARDVTTVGSATLASRLLAFVRDMGIAAVLGAGVFADAFFAVLQIANVFRHMLAEGALNAAFVPMWLRIKGAQGEAGADRFVREVFGATILTAGAVAAIGVIFASAVIGVLMPGFDGERHAAAAAYLQIAAPYVALAGLGAVIAALLSAEGRVGAVSFGIVTFNAVLLLGLAWAAVFGAAVPALTGAILAHAIVLAGIAQLVVIGVAFWRLRRGRRGRGRRGRGRRDPVRRRLGFSIETWRFFALAGPGLLAAGMPQLKLMAGAMVASSSEAAVSWLYYANRLYELPLGVVSIVVAAVMAPRIAASLRGGDGVAHSAPPIRPRSRRRWRRSAPGCPAMRSKRCWVRCRSRTRMPEPRCSRRWRGSPPR
jgi:putative peptidoglycan lipid II flippase